MDLHGFFRGVPGKQGPVHDPLLVLRPRGSVRPLTFGATGLWILAISFLLLKEGRSRPVALLGILLSIVFELVVVGWATPSMRLLTALASAGGIVFGPVWFALMGLRLRQAS